MARAILALAFLWVLVFDGCSLGYDITERVGSDISGLFKNPYTSRFYSNSSEKTSILIMNDTMIENQLYKHVYFGFESRFFLNSEKFIYRRMEAGGKTVILPFLCKVVIEGMKEFKEYEGDLYSYYYSFIVESLSFALKDSIFYDNAYFIRSSSRIVSEAFDTSFTESYILTHDEGIVGIEEDGFYMILDSIR